AVGSFIAASITPGPTVRKGMSSCCRHGSRCRRRKVRAGHEARCLLVQPVMRGRRWRWWHWLVGALALILVVGFAVSRLGNEPLRRRIEAGMNAALKGYKVRIRQARFHPLGLGIDLV